METLITWLQKRGGAAMCIQIRAKVTARAKLGLAMEKPKVNCMTEAIYLKTHLITQLMHTAKSMHYFVTIGNAMDSGNYSIDILSTQWGMDRMLQFSPWLAVDKSPQYEYSLYMVTETNLPLGVTHPGFCIVCTVKTDILCPKLLCPMCCECNVCTCQFSDQTSKDHHQFLWCTHCDSPTQEPMCKLCGYCKQCCNSCSRKHN